MITRIIRRWVMVMMVMVMNDVEGGVATTSASADMAGMNTTTSSRRGRSDKPRSVIFGMVVKPFLKGKKKMRKLGRKKKKKKDEDVAGVTSSYVPPTTEMV